MTTPHDSEPMTPQEFAQFIQSLIGNIPILKPLHQAMVAEKFKKLELIAGLAYGRAWHNNGGMTYTKDNQPFPNHTVPHLREAWLNSWLDNHKAAFGYGVQNPGF